MANEATIRAALSFTKGGIVGFGRDSGDIQFDVTGTNPLHTRQTVGTSAEPLLLGDVGTPGYILAYNAGPNTIKVQAGSGGTPVPKIKPFKWALFEFDTATPYVIAVAAPSDLVFWLLPEGADDDGDEE